MYPGTGRTNEDNLVLVLVQQQGSSIGQPEHPESPAKRDFDDEAMASGDSSPNVEFSNPLTMAEGNISADDEMLSAAQMIAANEAEMTEEELSDLTYAFQAADMDGGGAIDCDEFAMMLAVMGCDLSMDQVKEVIGDAKDGFGAWKKMADTENIAKCQRIWDEYDADNSGTMDLGEVNAVIAKLQSMGFSPEPMSAADMADGELDFAEFSAWFLKQEGLPDDFSAPKGGTPHPGGPKSEGMFGKALGSVMHPFSKMSKKAVAGPMSLMEASAKLMKKDADPALDPEDEKFDPETHMLALMADRNELIFGERPTNRQSMHFAGKTYSQSSP